MEWDEIPEAVTAWSDLLAPVADVIKRAVADIYTTSDVGIYVHPGTGTVGLISHNEDLADLALCKEALDRVVSDRDMVPLFFNYSEDRLDDPQSCWVKVAHSAAIQRMGELLNFFPGQYPGGIPNAPSPIAAMLTSGVLGAGLGYGAGRLASKILPRGYGDRLGSTGAILGGLAGAAPGAVWGAVNQKNDHSLGDAWPLDTPSTTPAGRDEDPNSWLYGKEAVDRLLQAVPIPERVANFFPKEAGDTLADPALLDVHVDALGRTLWQSGASPQLAGMTMGAMYAAQQFPDPRSSPEIVTGNQLGQLAMGAAGNYISGLAVGRALNTVIGTPYRTSQYGAGAVALGVIGSVVPRLFGRE